MADRDRVMMLLGQETTRGRLYAGLYLLLGGLFLGITALGLFFYAGTREGASLFAWREAALILGALSISGFFVGISVALPSRPAMRVASYVGMGFCAVAIFLFALHYPMHFNVQNSPNPDQADYTALDTILFAVGLVLIAVGAFVSVVGYWIESLRWGAQGEAEDEWTGKGYEVPDWVVEQDLIDAEKRHGVSWGLGDNKKDAVTIELPDISDGAVIGGKGKVKKVRLSGARVDKATAGLRTTRPEFARTRELDSEWADEAVEALRNFQREKEAKPHEFTPKVGFWARLLRRRSKLTPIERALEEAQEGIEVGGGGNAKTIVIGDED